jgi:hypothetical protein
MRKFVFVFAVLVSSLFLCDSAASRVYRFGLGVIVGEPTGISGKKWLRHDAAIDGAIAWAFTDETSLHLHGDFLLHKFDLFDVTEGALPFYYGIGGRIRFDEEDSRIGVRIPLGLDYLFEGSRFDLFLELVPILDLAPDTELNLNAGLGARYFF